LQEKYNDIVKFIRKVFNEPTKNIYLHEPLFVGNERKYVMDAIDSTFVSSVGKYVDRFEEMMREITGAKHAVATVNGTAALHMSLIVAGVQRNDLVLTQPLSFIATCNAISYIGATPMFTDVAMDTLGLCPNKLNDFLTVNAEVKNGTCYYKPTGQRISACVPMHTFGHPAALSQLVEVCQKYHIPLVEDAAESIGSLYHQKHTGTMGLLGAFSFNGNKTVTSGGGGCIITNSDKLGKLAKHLTTQAKVPHQWKFEHDSIGYNYRLPNINAALACAQLEQLDTYIVNKRKLAQQYFSFFADTPITFINEPSGTFSNYWLNSILLKDAQERDAFLTYTNSCGIITRPVWALMTNLPMFKNCIAGNLDNAQNIEDRLVNLPSSVLLEKA
jgi:perosamine synthetase